MLDYFESIGRGKERGIRHQLELGDDEKFNIALYGRHIIGAMLQASGLIFLKRVKGNETSVAASGEAVAIVNYNRNIDKIKVTTLSLIHKCFSIRRIVFN